MKLKKWICAASALCLGLSLAACSGNGTAVYVQNVAELSGSGLIAPGDRFAGMIVAENVTEIQKDMDKSVAELLVAAGDNVTEGQKLFAYDTDELQLVLDKQKLEKEQLETMISSYTDQIKELERQRKQAPQKDQLRYTVEIQTLEVQLKESKLNLEAKDKEIAKSEEILKNAEVFSPVAGRIQSINEKGTDSNGNPAAFMVIQQEGSFRVEGSLGELQRGGIMEGTRMKVISRTDPNRFWLGTVALVDYDNPSQGDSSGGMMIYPGGGSELTNASSYPFFVVLDSTDGLILGQHVYMEIATAAVEGVRISGAFVCYDEAGNAFVWADKRGKLEKRAVTLGEYDMMTDSYTVLEGLSGEDYIAFPEELCAVGVPTTKQLPVEEDPELPEEMPDMLPAMEGGVA